MRTLTAFLLILVLAAAGFLIFIYSGVYNIAASDEHFGPVRWVLQTTLDNSVRAHAGEVKVPSLERYSKEEGFRHFDKLCITCHGAPGVAASEIGAGLRPQAPELSKQVDKWMTAELFWIVNHGFKYTGMPAFGKTHSEEELWNMVAFLKELPSISPEEYKELRQQYGTGQGEQHQGNGQEYQPEQHQQQNFLMEEVIIHRQAI